MKGITPVIAVILLLLITISLVGFAFIYFSRITETVQTNTESQLENQLQNQQKRIRIESAAGTTVAVRNIGTVTINPAEFAVFFNNSLDTGCVFTALGPQSVGTCTLTLTANCQDQTIRVSTPGGSDSRICD